MPPSREEDLEWLYGQRPPRSDPEPTRVLPPVDAPPEPAAGPSSWSPLPPPPPPDRIVPAPRPLPPPGQTASRAGRTRRRRHPIRALFAVLGVLLLLVVGGLLAVPIYAWSQVQRVDATPAGQRPGDQPGTTFLLVGSDSREGLTRAERSRLGTGSSAGQRTDTIMLVSIPPGGKPALISLPRDSYVPIPGRGSNKINAAYAFGGPQLMVQTVEQATALRIDGYAEIGFGGFVQVIDALGGVRMCLPSAIQDQDSHLDLPKGCQTLAGKDALGYVRMRKADARGDLGRVERQRQMIGAVAKKAATPATVLNPIRYYNFCVAAGKAIRLGTDTSVLQTVRLMLAMRKIANGSGLTLTVPVANPGAATPVGSAVLWDETQAKKMFADIARGDTSQLSKYAAR